MAKRDDRIITSDSSPMKYGTERAGAKKTSNYARKTGTPVKVITVTIE